MEFLQANWFSVLAVGAYLIAELIKYGRKDQKMDTVITSVDKLATSFTAHERKFNDHVANNDVHVTDMLLELLRERNDYAKNEFANTRTDIQRVETMLSAMMK